MIVHNLRLAFARMIVSLEMGGVTFLRFTRMCVCVCVEDEDTLGQLFVKDEDMREELKEYFCCCLVWVFCFVFVFCERFFGSLYLESQGLFFALPKSTWPKG